MWFENRLVEVLIFEMKSVFYLTLKKTWVLNRKLALVELQTAKLKEKKEKCI